MFSSRFHHWNSVDKPILRHHAQDRWYLTIKVCLPGSCRGEILLKIVTIYYICCRKLSSFYPHSKHRCLEWDDAKGVAQSSIVHPGVSPFSRNNFSLIDCIATAIQADPEAAFRKEPSRETFSCFNLLKDYMVNWIIILSIMIEFLRILYFFLLGRKS